MWDQVSFPNQFLTLYLFNAVSKQISHMAVSPIREGLWKLWNCDWLCIFGRDNGSEIRISTVYKAEGIPKYFWTLRNGILHHSFESNCNQGGEELEVLAWRTRHCGKTLEILLDIAGGYISSKLKKRLVSNMSSFWNLLFQHSHNLELFHILIWETRQIEDHWLASTNIWEVLF